MPDSVKKCFHLRRHDIDPVDDVGSFRLGFQVDICSVPSCSETSLLFCNDLPFVAETA